MLTGKPARSTLASGTDDKHAAAIACRCTATAVTGDHRAAVMFTLIETAKLSDVDPKAWLADVLVRIPDHPMQRLDDLLPWAWKAARDAATAIKAAA